MVNEGVIFNQAQFGYPSRPLIALDHVLPSGRLVAMVGKNGVGKSTVIKTLCGQQALLSGALFISGKNVADLTVQELAQHVAAVFTGRLSGFHLTPREVIATARMPYTNWMNRLSPEDEQVIAAVMDQYGITAFSQQPLQQLSDGMYQRVLLARAVAQQTPVLVLDEPTAFLDFASRHEVFALLKAQAALGKSILISTHDLDLVMKYCDEVLLLDPTGAEYFAVTQARDSEKFMALGGRYL
jgi:iron complex transport system ATP-binding protein